MKTFVQDLRFAARSMIRTPGFFIVAVITLALAIGANTAIFSIVNAIILRPYPYPEPDQLVVIRSVNTKIDVDNTALGTLDYLDFRKQNQLFQDIALVRTRRFNLAGVEEPVRVNGATATATLFKVLRSKPILGRTFLESEDAPGAPRVVVLSQPLWERYFNSDRQIVGKPVKLDGEIYTVIGVIPPSAQFPDTDQTQLFVPEAIDLAQELRHSRTHLAIGRLKPGVSVQQAQVELSGIAKRLEKEYPETNAFWDVRVLSLREFRTRRFAALSLILLGVVAMVLMIACVNVANLLLQRSAARNREIAVRSAVGAGRGRIVRQLLTESMVLGFFGGVLGLVLANWGLKLLVRAIPQELPSYMNEFGIDGQVLAFMVAISVITAIFFGLAPALRLSRPNLTESLSEAGARSGGGRRQRMRNTLIVLEVALSLILLIGAGLMIKSFRRLQNIDPGFNPKNVLAFQMVMPENKYPDPAMRKEFLRRAVERFSSLPGVQTVGTSTDMPIRGGLSARFTVDGQSEDARKENPLASFRLVSGDFFGATQVRITKGRPLQQADFSETPQAIVVNEHFANRFWRGQDPLGRRVRIDVTKDDPWLTVVGIAGNLNGPETEGEERLEVYTPYPLVADTAYPGIDVMIRTAGDPTSVATSVRKTMTALDPDIPVANLRSMEELLSDSFWLQRISSMLFGVFAAVALALATVGMYGSMAYAVSQRTREIGIRMALGAHGGDVLKMVLRQGIVLLAIALPLGLAGAFGLSRLLRRLLYEVRATDPMTFLVVTLFIVVIAMIATYIPARRATKVTPVVALKYD
jgi:putative ABC transport system permease protein